MLDEANTKRAAAERDAASARAELAECRDRLLAAYA